MAMEKFHYDHKGKKITLPLMNQIPFGVARKLRKESEEEQLYGMIEMVADKKSLDIIDQMNPDEVKAMMEAWGKSSEITPGE